MTSRHAAYIHANTENTGLGSPPAVCYKRPELLVMRRTWRDSSWELNLSSCQSAVTHRWRRICSLHVPYRSTETVQTLIFKASWSAIRNTTTFAV